MTCTTSYFHLNNSKLFWNLDDYHGGWDGKTGHNSPLYGMRKEKKQFREWNVNNSMHLWASLGCPREKLNMGIAAYGIGVSTLVFN